MSKSVRKLTYTSIAAAIVFMVTRLIVIPVTVSTTGAYINFGDMSIYVTSYLLGGPMAGLAAAVGSGLADLTAGAAVYAPATFIIKGLMGLTAGLLMRRRKFWVYAVACALGGAIMTAGYGLYETFVFGFATALANAPANLIQWGASLVIAAVLFPVAERIRKVTHLEELQGQ
jgi:uncharacterized membrane protein